MAEYSARRLATGFSWAECPRWLGGEFHFADMYAARIVRLDAAGQPHVVLDLSGRRTLGDVPMVVAGFDRLPDGRLVVNSMFERVTLVVDAGDVSVLADWRSIAPGPINELVTDTAGRVYVSQIGYSLWDSEEPRETPLLAIEPDGTLRELTAAGTLQAANGMAISEDGTLFVTAESPRRRILAFDRAEDGTLSGRRVFAEVDLLPDGICLDSEHAVWAAQPGAAGAIRLREGGVVTDRVSVDAELAGRSVACVLGGPDRTTLHVCCGFEVFDFAKSVREAQGSIWSAEVPVSAGGARP